MEAFKGASESLHQLVRAISAIDRFGKEAFPTDHRVILLGSGAMVGWALGRRQLGELKKELESAIPSRLGPGTIVDVHWLGCPKLDAKFSADATLHSIELYAHGIQDAVEEFPDATIDFVCHSLSGVATVFWTLSSAKHEDLLRINSITTINSPLKPHNGLLEACEEYLAKNHTLFGARRIPSVAWELREGSIIHSVISGWNLPLYLLNIYTLGDTLVPPEIATLDGKCESYRFDGTKLSGGLKAHTQALKDPDVHKKIINTICTSHLPASSIGPPGYLNPEPTSP